MSARVASTGNKRDWVSPEWSQRAMNVLQETLDVHPELKVEMVKFLIDNGFWSDKLTAHSAMSRFNGNLNPDRPGEFFKLSEVWALMKRFGRHALFVAMAEDLGYEVRRKPTDERILDAVERLAHELQRSNDAAQLARQQLGFLTEVHPLRIHPVFQRGAGAFDMPAPDEVGPAEPAQDVEGLGF